MDPTLLIIIVFIVAPLIERLLKASKQGQQDQLPPRQRPQQGIPPRPGQPDDEVPRTMHQQQHEDARNRVVIRREEDETAATMLPDDLWEILTGEKRPPPAREAPPEQHEEEFADEYEYEEEAQTLETTSAGEWISLPPEPEPAPPTQPSRGTVPASRPSAWADYRRERELSRAEEGYVRPIPRRDYPQVVSLEALEIDDEARHDEFHRRLERDAQRVVTPRAHRFTSDEDLRRAIIMSEVLGRPKGLEPDSP